MKFIILHEIHGYTNIDIITDEAIVRKILHNNR